MAFSVIDKLTQLRDLVTTGKEPGKVVGVLPDGNHGYLDGGAGGSFDPDDPLDYLTFRDTVDGTLWQVEVTSGAWAFTDVSSAALVTEAGDTMVTESGDTLVTEG